MSSPTQYVINASPKDVKFDFENLFNTQSYKQATPVELKEYDNFGLIQPEKIRDNCDFGIDCNDWQKLQEETQSFLKFPKMVSCKMEEGN